MSPKSQRQLVTEFGFEITSRTLAFFSDFQWSDETTFRGMQTPTSKLHRSYRINIQDYDLTVTLSSIFHLLSNELSSIIVNRRIPRITQNGNIWSWWRDSNMRDSISRQNDDIHSNNNTTTTHANCTQHEWQKERRRRKKHHQIFVGESEQSRTK